MNIKSFFYRYLSFILAKSALLVGKSFIVILSFNWLSLDDFSKLAVALSISEILRGFSDAGAETLVYSRLSSDSSPLSNMLIQVMRARIWLALLMSITSAMICYLYFDPNFSIIFLLPFISAIQNTSFAFLQKQKNFKDIFKLVLFVLTVSLIAILSSFLWRPQGGMLAFLILVPELFSAILAFFITKNLWSFITKKIGFSFKFLIKIRNYLLPSMGVAVLVLVYTRIDALLVLPLLGHSEQSNYSVAFRFVEPIFLLFSFASITLLSELGAKGTTDSRGYIKSIYMMLNTRLIIILLLLAIAAAFLLKALSMTVFNFTEHSSILVFLMVLVLPIKLTNNFLSTLLQRGARFHNVFFATLQTFLLTYIFGYFFGVTFGVKGIIFATFLAELLNLIHQKLAVKFMINRYQNS
jgi:O-antigen/teichoic acid export membrane protein